MNIIPIARHNYCSKVFVAVYSNLDFSGYVELLAGSSIENCNTFDLRSSSDSDEHKKSSFKKVMQCVLTQRSE